MAEETRVAATIILCERLDEQSLIKLLAGRMISIGEKEMNLHGLPIEGLARFLAESRINHEQFQMSVQNEIHTKYKEDIRNVPSFQDPLLTNTHMRVAKLTAKCYRVRCEAIFDMVGIHILGSLGSWSYNNLRDDLTQLRKLTKKLGRLTARKNRNLGSPYFFFDIGNILKLRRIQKERGIDNKEIESFANEFSQDWMKGMV